MMMKTGSADSICRRTKKSHPYCQHIGWIQKTKSGFRLFREKSKIESTINEWKNMEKQLSGYEIHRLTADMKIITDHSSEYFHENESAAFF